MLAVGCRRSAAFLPSASATTAPADQMKVQVSVNDSRNPDVEVHGARLGGALHRPQHRHEAAKFVIGGLDTGLKARGRRGRSRPSSCCAAASPLRRLDVSPRSKRVLQGIFRVV